jgi:hypothetical protein
MIKPETAQEELIVRLGRDHRLAHQTLFAHRHPDETPPFHYEIIDDLHGSSHRVLELAFRGAAKSTIAEEYICIDACYRRFRNFIIVGESFTRASERLQAVAHELDFNEHLRTLFGDLHGPTWNEDKLVLSNGVVIQAFGRGQSLRGTKHEDVRPDACLIDDVEDEESVNSPDGRDKTERWLMRTLLPALAPKAKVRMLANMLDPDCLAVRLRKSGVWTVREYPWEYLGQDGARRATWPARFPLDHIDGTRREYEAAGMLNEYQQEYMVEAVDPSAKTFKTEHIRVEPTARTWQPTWAMYDPARTTGVKSAHTGKVVCSWVGTRLIVWEGDGQLWMPDRIIDDMFETNERYTPIALGVEKTGLEEFLMQPLRTEQVKRHTILPLKVMPAPTGKISFIKSLQPYFASGEIVFAKDLPVLKQQLLSFPTGRIDVPNALAYMLRMRPGLPIYENFSQANVKEDLVVLRQHGSFLAVGATRQYTTAVLVQSTGTALRVLADWVCEGDPGNVLGDILADVVLVVPTKPAVFAGQQHWGSYDTVGLRAACQRLKVTLRTAGDPTVGREELRKKIDALTHGTSSLQVSPRARWTLNAFAGGYARTVKPGAQELLGVADDGPYKTLMEGLEAFVATAASGVVGDGADQRNYARDPITGRKYLSAKPTVSGGSQDLKIQET